MRIQIAAVGVAGMLALGLASAPAASARTGPAVGETVLKHGTWHKFESVYWSRPGRIALIEPDNREVNGLPGSRGPAPGDRQRRPEEASAAAARPPSSRSAARVTGTSPGCRSRRSRPRSSAGRRCSREPPAECGGSLVTDSCRAEGPGLRKRPGPWLPGLPCCAGQLGFPRCRPGRVLADKAYRSRANRAYLRRRGDPVHHPGEKADQARHRQNKGCAGGRPPAFGPALYKLRHAVECGIGLSSQTGPWLPDTTSSPSATKPPCTSPPSTSGSHATYETGPRRPGPFACPRPDKTLPPILIGNLKNLGTTLSEHCRQVEWLKLVRCLAGPQRRNKLNYGGVNQANTHRGN